MRNVRFYLAALIGLATFLVYLPALRNGFVYWDDNSYIFENPYIRSLDAAFFRWAFFDFHVSNWHPLTWVSHALDYAVWGLNPLGHHLTSIALHAINTAIVVLLALKLLEIARERRTPGAPTPLPNDRTILIAAGVTGLLFGIHPLHVESVAWVSERKDLLCGLFFLLSIMAYMRYATNTEKIISKTSLSVIPAQAGTQSSQGMLDCPIKSGNDIERVFSHRFLSRTNANYLASLVFFILALMSKPMAVTLPVVLLILDWYPFNRIRSLKTAGEACVEKIPFIVLSGISSIITISAQQSGGSITTTEAAPLTVRMFVAIKSLAGYLWKMLPLDLIPLHPYPKSVSLLSAEYVVPALFVVIISVVCVVNLKKQKAWLAVWGYYIVTLVPVLGIIQVGSQAMADRYTYLPSLGPFLMTGVMAAWSATRVREGWGVTGGRFSAALALLAFVPLSYLTVQQTRVWHDSVTLWTYELDKEPDERHAFVNRGIAFMDAGQLEKAIEDFNKAISLSASDHIALYNRGVAFAKLNLVGQAIADYGAAIAAKPSYHNAYNNRGILYERLGQFDRAFADYSAAISLSPSDHKAYVNRALIFDRTGQLNRALDDLARAISLKPDDPDAYYNRGFIFNRMGRLDRALADFDAAVSLSPNDPDAYYNRGMVLSKMGEINRALADFDRTISLNPSYYQAYYNRGLIYQKTGRMDEANRDFMTWEKYSPKK